MQRCGNRAKVRAFRERGPEAVAKVGGRNDHAHQSAETLHTNPAFSQATIASAGRTLYIGGQNGTDAEGAIVSDDAGEQSAQAMRNMLAILDEVGAESKTWRS